MTDITTEPITTGNERRHFEVDAEKRTIYGLAVPYGEATHSEGSKFQFSQGVLELPADPSRIKLLVSHDCSAAVGKATELTESPEGLWARFSVARGAKGDEALSMAADGVWDGLSIGLRDGATFSKKGTVTHFSRAVLSEISLTPDPAFGSARVAAVVAEAPSNTNQEGRPDMGDTTTGAPAGAPQGFDMAALIAAIRESAPVQREVINPASPVGFEADESPYAFNAARGLFSPGGEHEFSTDLIASARGDQEAGERAMSFVQAQFAVAQTNVQSALAAGARPDLYVGPRDYRYPLFNAVNKGSLADGRPFSFPRFNSATGLVADHTEGIEPTPGAFTATGQTVTPKAMSGKVEITREVFDQGGNPQVSNLIFAKMVQSWNEALEAAVSTELQAQAANITDIALPASAVNAALVDPLLAAFADLQFQRGGFRFDFLATQIDLFKALAAASGTDGRKLLPYFGPTNSSGQSSAGFSSLNVQGVEAIPSWALAASAATSTNSWLIDPSAVSAWATTPQRFDFQYRVAFVDLAIWGYRAVAVNDFAGVRQVTYTRPV